MVQKIGSDDGNSRTSAVGGFRLRFARGIEQKARFAFGVDPNHNLSFPLFGMEETNRQLFAERLVTQQNRPSRNNRTYRPCAFGRIRPPMRAEACDAEWHRIRHPRLRGRRPTIRRSWGQRRQLLFGVIVPMTNKLPFELGASLRGGGGAFRPKRSFRRSKAWKSSSITGLSGPASDAC